MEPGSAATIGSLASTLRDAAFFVGILVAGWKARDIVQPAVDFFKESKTLMVRANLHMSKMEDSMSLLLNNHLPHMAEDIKRLQHGRKTDEESAAGPVE